VIEIAAVHSVRQRPWLEGIFERFNVIRLAQGEFTDAHDLGSGCCAGGRCVAIDFVKNGMVAAGHCRNGS